MTASAECLETSPFEKLEMIHLQYPLPTQTDLTDRFQIDLQLLDIHPYLHLHNHFGKVESR